MTEHLSFETLILSGDPVSPEQGAALDAHLAECPECTLLRQRWMAVRRRLERAHQVEPPAGFTARIIGRLELLERRRLDRQVRLSLAFSFVGSLLVMGLLGVSLLANLGGFGSGALKTISLIQVQATIAWGLISALAEAVPEAGASALAVGLALAGATAVLGATLLWVVSIYRLSFQPIMKGAHK